MLRPGKVHILTLETRMVQRLILGENEDAECRRVYTALNGQLFSARLLRKLPTSGNRGQKWGTQFHVARDVAPDAPSGGLVKKQLPAQFGNSP